MANTAIPNSALVVGGNADVAGTAIVAADTHVITPTKRSAKLLIRVVNTFAGSKVATLVAGDNPPADASVAATVTLADGSTTPTVGWFVVDAAKYMQNDGTLQITVAASMTGFITAFQIP